MLHGQPAHADAGLHADAGRYPATDGLHPHAHVRARLVDRAALDVPRDLRRQGVAPHALRARGLRQRLQDLCFVGEHLPRHAQAQLLRAQRRVERGLRARQQRRDVLRRHDEAHELPAGDHGDVDAVHAAPRVQRGPARHAAVDRAGVVDALVEAVLDQPVRDALGDGQAEVQRKADRPGAFALCGNLGPQLQGRQFEVVGRNHGEVVAHVDGEDAQGPGAPVARQVLEPVLARVQHGLRHDVIVRHDPAPVVDGEAAAVEGARRGGVEETADLHHRGACGIEPHLRLARELLARDVGIDRGLVDSVPRWRLFFGRRTGRHLDRPFGRRLSGFRGIRRLSDGAGHGSAQAEGGDEAGKRHMGSVSQTVRGSARRPRQN